ncbi:MAG: glycosyltransferase [Solirubrobacteraceae bacterium]
MTQRAVLLVHSSSGRYGADRQLALIASGLLERARYRPVVVLPTRGALAGDLERSGVEVLTSELSILRRSELNPRGLASLAVRAASDSLRLRRLIRKREIALVHSNTTVILGGAAAAAAARVPHVWHVREIYSRFGRAWPPYRALLGTAAALPCVSAATAAQFDRPGRGRGRVRVIHDGLAIDAVKAPRAAARAALGLPADTPVIAVLGRITDWKGQDVLVRALAQPELTERGAIGLLAGDVWPGAESRGEAIHELAEMLGVRDRVVFTGFRDDVENLYGAADLIAVPSTEPDPLPGSAVEAAAAGCTVIAAAHGGLPEIITDGVSGRLVAAGDAAALAQVSAELLDDPALCRRLGDAAAADARARFAPTRLLDDVERLYDGLIRRA